jgi:hypothetical protein
MSIGSVSSSTYPYSTSNTQKPQNQDLLNLGKALQSGNLADAQSAFASFTQNLPGTSSTGPFSSSGTLGTDVKSLQSALQSGNVSGAQQAFSKLTTDMKGMHQAHGAHHRHGGGNSTDSSSDATTSTSSTDSTSSSDPIANLVNMLSQTIGGAVNQQA